MQAGCQAVGLGEEKKVLNPFFLTNIYSGQSQEH